MQSICTDGFKISNADQKAWDHYFNITPTQWSSDIFLSTVNKAVSAILKDWFELYKSKQIGNINSDLSILIPAIVSMEEFRPYNIPTPTSYEKFDKTDPETVQRDDLRLIEIWEDGFEMQDYEKIALDAFYASAENYLYWLMENKIYRIKLSFVKEYEEQMIRIGESFPARHDAFISYITSKEGYKNRIQRDAEMLAKLEEKRVIIPDEEN